MNSFNTFSIVLRPTENRKIYENDSCHQGVLTYSLKKNSSVLWIFPKEVIQLKHKDTCSMII